MRPNRSRVLLGKATAYSLFMTLLLLIPFAHSYSPFKVIAPPSGTFHLLIITDAPFNEPCQRLADWKISTGMSALVISWQDLNSTYAGCDAPERIKRGIEEYHRLCRTRYVLLVGDVDRFPVRYIRLDWNVSTPNKIHSADFVYSAADLYYADLYNANGDFQTWDADGNQIYGELWGAHVLRGQGNINHDAIDMEPDVAVGRVPASTIGEVDNFVDKVISYEKNAVWTTSPWVRNALLIANGVPDVGHYALSEDIGIDLSVAGFSLVKLYDVDPSNHPRPYPSPLRPSHATIVDELNYGKGYVNFGGHGHPLGCPSFGETLGDYQVLVANCTAAGFDNKQAWHTRFCPEISGTPLIGNFSITTLDSILFVQNNGSLYYSPNFDLTSYSFAYTSHSTRLATWLMIGHPLLGDFTGSGKDSIAVFHGTTGEVWVANHWQIFHGTAPYTPPLWHSGFLSGFEIHFVGDFNGDGMDDIAHYDLSAVQVALSSGSWFGTKSSWHTSLPTSGFPVVGDYNGDGMDDIAFVDKGSGDIQVALTDGQKFENAATWRSAFCPGDLNYGAKVKSGDINGDGMDDLILFLIDSQIGGDRTVGSDRFFLRGDVMTTLSDGSSFTTPERWHENFCWGNQIPEVGDFDGDGRVDIITFKRTPASDPFRLLHNRDKYPIIFAGSCSTAQFANVPPWRYYFDVTNTSHLGSDNSEVFPDALFHGNMYKIPPAPAPLQAYDPSCMAERFLVEYNDRGAVGYIGGVEVLQSGPTNEINKYFIYHYCRALGTLGNQWNNAIIDYLDAHGFGRCETSLIATSWTDVSYYHAPMKTMFFGDPSLRVLGTGTPPPQTPDPILVVIIAGGIITITIITSVVTILVMRRRYHRGI